MRDYGAQERKQGAMFLDTFKSKVREKFTPSSDMKPYINSNGVFTAIALALACSGCAVAKGKLASIAKTDTLSGSTTSEISQAMALDNPEDGRANADQEGQDLLAIQSASKRIDGSVESALRNDVPIDQYNYSSHGAANYPAVTKVVPSKAGGCSSGCSH